MHKMLFVGTVATLAMLVAAKADPVGLGAYVDENGFINVQALKCEQLANTYQEDANLLTAWYSGWYNGLGHKHYFNMKASRDAEHLTIVFCKEHPEERIIHAIGIVIDRMRAEHGIEVGKE